MAWSIQSFTSIGMLNSCSRLAGAFTGVPAGFLGIDLTATFFAAVFFAVAITFPSSSYELCPCLQQTQSTNQRCRRPSTDRLLRVPTCLHPE